MSYKAIVEDVDVWWRKRVSSRKRPHFASVSTDTDPRKVSPSHYGPFFSAVFSPGVRTFCFINADNCHKFIRDYGATAATNPRS